MDPTTLLRCPKATIQTNAGRERYAQEQDA
jgi:hypothetical protein